MTQIRGLVTSLITTHEPPSRGPFNPRGKKAGAYGGVLQQLPGGGLTGKALILYRFRV